MYGSPAFSRFVGPKPGKFFRRPKTRDECLFVYVDEEKQVTYPRRGADHSAMFRRPRHGGVCESDGRIDAAKIGQEHVKMRRAAKEKDKDGKVTIDFSTSIIGVCARMLRFWKRGGGGNRALEDWR